MYCIIKCNVQRKQARVKNADFSSSVLHSCNEKTQICVTRPQCVNIAIYSQSIDKLFLEMFSVQITHQHTQQHPL